MPTRMSYHLFALPCQHMQQLPTALFNPETSVLIQKRHPYTANLNSETLGDSKNATLHCGDVLGSQITATVLQHIMTRRLVCHRAKQQQRSCYPFALPCQRMHQQSCSIS